MKDDKRSSLWMPTVPSGQGKMLFLDELTQPTDFRGIPAMTGPKPKTLKAALARIDELERLAEAVRQQNQLNLARLESKVEVLSDLIYDKLDK